MSLELMKTVKEQNLPVRPHYFWPLLTQPLKENNVAGTNTHANTDSSERLISPLLKKSCSIVPQ